MRGMLHPVVDLHRFIYCIQRHYFADGDCPTHLLYSSHHIYLAKEDSWSTDSIRAFQTRQMGYPHQHVLASLPFVHYHLDTVPDGASGNRIEYELHWTDPASRHPWWHNRLGHQRA